MERYLRAGSRRHVAGHPQSLLARAVNKTAAPPYPFLPYSHFNLATSIPPVKWDAETVTEPPDITRWRGFTLC
jgi:hypothetical protein